MLTPAPEALVGRESELDLMTRLLLGVEGPRAVLLEGEAGIGKTTLWEEGVRVSREAVGVVLSCRPAETEAELPFSALGDLLEPVLDTALPLLPEPQRAALEVALLRATPAATPTNRLAVSQAVLSILRDGAGTSLVAIDDLQWLDAPSDEVLRFALRRLGDAPVRLLLARRGGPDESVPLGLDRGLSVERVTLGPLTIDELDRVVAARLDVRLPRPRLVELHRTSRGNPYYATEIVRALARHGDPAAWAGALPVPDSVGALLRRRLEALPRATGDILLVAAAASHPTTALLEAVAGSNDGLSEALDAGILTTEGQRIRFSHPLLASVAYGSASARSRRDVHRRLAAAASEPGERARHLALATEIPDPGVSAELEAAAADAARRGAPSSAAGLLEHAVRLTPPPRTADRRRRLAAAAEHHYAAGDQARSRSILETLVEELPPGPERARLLAQLSHRVPYQQQGLELCRRALDEVGDDLALASDLHFFIAASARRATTLGEAAEHAQLALDRAKAARDGGRTGRALAMLGHVETIMGRTGGIGALERAGELEASHGALSLHFRASFLRGITLIYVGAFEQARPLLRAQLDLAGEQGDEVMHGVALSSLAELELRAGNWSLAHRYATEGAALQAQAAPLQDQVHHVLRAARVSAHMGKLDEARPVAAGLLEVAPLNGDRSAEISVRRDLGFMDLSSGNPESATNVLEPAVRMLVELGVGLFSAYPCVQDYVEACVASGDLDRARRANELLAVSGRPWEVAMHARGQALIAAAGSDRQAAETAIARALQAHARLEEPFELGRTLLVKGTVERRAKQRAAARETLTAALDVFDSLGAPLWAEKAAAELARIPGRAAASSDLTETERRVAELVREGLSNKEVAARLFVTVRTVEANLSKVYAKLGIRSRTELAQRL